MKKEEIIEEIMNGLKERLPSRRIELKKIRKNNGVEWTGILIFLKEDEHMAATHYVDGIVEKIMEGNTTVEKAIEGIIHMDEKAQVNSFVRQSWNDGMLDREEVLKKVHRNLINRDKNKELLEELPHKAFANLEIVYRVQLSPSASYLVRNDMMEHHNITLEELDSAAYNNDKSTWILESMREMLLRVSGRDIGSDDLGIFVLTNNIISHGAAAIADISFIKSVSNKFGGDFFIIPSSINECLLVPESMGMNLEIIKNMIKDINATEIADRDILSDSLYRYDSAKEMVMVA